ncbi:MarR family winged helix-turn-helix transcriptional regulator [Streptomyces puniciscabiei]|uniref:MarR family winged helix-turn-helix transcriptional regulator n=1 Tax=Streptomyces puniciscabiei TaxID=164348 RepID=UPI000A8AB152|nr:MarR family winged helix-turn-helix transcriptional regulator [Streptomyces puniciscabiei]
MREAVAARLMILARHMSQGCRVVLDADGLKYWQYKVLLTLRRSGPPYESGPSVLAERLGLTQGALSARLGPIEEAGLITRTHESGDRRRVRAGLTEAGHAVFAAHAAAEDAGEGALLSALTETERRTLADLLPTLVLAVEGEPGASSPGSPAPIRSRSTGR